MNDEKFYITGLIYADTLGEICDGIVGSIEDGFEYSLGKGESNMKAWFDEDDLDFVVTEEREEWEDNGKDVLSVVKEQLK